MYVLRLSIGTEVIELRIDDENINWRKIALNVIFVTMVYAVLLILEV
jgi:hypothetical protein